MCCDVCSTPIGRHLSVTDFLQLCIDHHIHALPSSASASASTTSTSLSSSPSSPALPPSILPRVALGVDAAALRQVFAAATLHTAPSAGGAPVMNFVAFKMVQHSIFFVCVCGVVWCSELGVDFWGCVCGWLGVGFDRYFGFG
jgi:hypothetical protein